jgi:hypothetical protein
MQPSALKMLGGRQALRQKGEEIVRLLTLLWLVVHFALTVVYVMPLNPMNAAVQPLLDATVGTYFSQNWKLFSPEPLAQNYALLIRPLSDEQAAASKNGLPSDGWFDVTTPFWVRFQHNRFSAYDRLTRPQVNALLNWLSGGSSLEPWQQSCQMGDTKACAYFEEQLRLVRAQEAEVLAKAASAFCKDVSEPCRGATHVALRAHEELGVAWSLRYNAAQSAAHDMELGVYPIDMNVASAGIYLTGKRQ